LGSIYPKEFYYDVSGALFGFIIKNKVGIFLRGLLRFIPYFPNVFLLMLCGFVFRITQIPNKVDSATFEPPQDDSASQGIKLQTAISFKRIECS
jgi:hypothetical protein